VRDVKKGLQVWAPGKVGLQMHNVHSLSFGNICVSDLVICG